MKSFAIIDNERENRTIIGYLFFYSGANAFIIELCENLNEWDAPLLFQGLVKKGIYSVPEDISMLWVKERIIPPGRHNIGSILKNARLKEYNEMSLLMMTEGRCSQDSCSIQEIAEASIPDEIRSRSQSNVSECYPSGNDAVTCMFNDGSVKKALLKDLQKNCPDIRHAINNHDILNSVRIGVGGYRIVFNDTITVPAELLRKKGSDITISADDMREYASRNIVDTATACEIMQCTRQNISYYVKSGKLTPIISASKDNLFTRGDIIRLLYD